jgi:hypothetical protein
VPAGHLRLLLEVRRARKENQRWHHLRLRVQAAKRLAQ